MLSLAITRDRLAQRNRNIPASLPAAWAKLGNPARAGALAHSITNPSRQARALAKVAAALAQAGDFDLAETTARSIVEPGQASGGAGRGDGGAGAGG